MVESGALGLIVSSMRNLVGRCPDLEGGHRTVRWAGDAISMPLIGAAISRAARDDLEVGRD
jgi:hypothetical protein